MERRKNKINCSISVRQLFPASSEKVINRDDGHKRVSIRTTYISNSDSFIIDCCTGLVSDCLNLSLRIITYSKSRSFSLLRKIAQLWSFSLVLVSLHCFPLNAYIGYMILLPTYKVLHGIAPECFHWFIYLVWAYLPSVHRKTDCQPINQKQDYLSRQKTCVINTDYNLLPQ